MRAYSPILALVIAVSSASLAAAQDAVLGSELFADYCAACHGTDARGDGPMAEALTIAPTDLTKLSVDGSFPTLQIVRQIDGRAPLLAHGGDMPIFGRWFEGQGADVAMPGLGGQPILMPQPLADLVAYLMDIQS